MGMRALLASWGLMLCLLGALFLPGALYPPATVHAQSGFTFPLTKTFTDTDTSGWVLGGTAKLTLSLIHISEPTRPY